MIALHRGAASKLSLVDCIPEDSTADYVWTLPTPPGRTPASLVRKLNRQVDLKNDTPCALKRKVKTLIKPLWSNYRARGCDDVTEAVFAAQQDFLKPVEGVYEFSTWERRQFELRDCFKPDLVIKRKGVRVQHSFHHQQHRCCR